MSNQLSRQFLAILLPILFLSGFPRAEETTAPAQDRLAYQQAIQKALAKQVEWDFVDVPLTDVVEKLHDELKIPIVLDRKAITNYGMKTDMPVTFKVRGISAKSALSLVLHDLGLAFTIRSEMLFITLPDVADTNLVTEAYDVSDLVFGEDISEGADFDSLNDVICKSIKPTTWDDVGGPAPIESFQSAGLAAIVFANTDEVHERVANLLADLRAIRHPTKIPFKNDSSEIPILKSVPRIAEDDIRLALRKQVEWNFLDESLADVVKKVTADLKIPIILDCKSLNDVGVNTITPVTFAIRGTSAKSALRLMLRDLGATFLTRHEVLLITSSDTAENNLLTHSYDVTDLVLGEDNNIDANFTALIEQINTTIIPTTWDMVGGLGSILPYHSAGIRALVISQTDDVHDEVAELLAKLRAVRYLSNRPRNTNPSIPDASAEKQPPSAIPSTDSLTYLAEKKVCDALKKKVDWDIKDKPLFEVIDLLQKELCIAIRLDYKAIHGRGVAPETPITWKISGISAKSALEIVLKDLELTYMIRDEVLMITTHDTVDYNQTTRLHDVSDLPAYRTEDGKIIPDYDGLINAIKKSVHSTTWSGVGGSASICSFDAAHIQALVITQTSPIHEEISELLNNLRKLRKTPLTKDDLEKLPPPPAPKQASTVDAVGFNNTNEKLTGGLVAGVASKVKPLTPLEPDPVRDAVVQANNQFAFRLYFQLCEKDRNLFFSPYSIATVLAMAHAGARGDTAKEMAKTLHFTLKQEEIPQGYQSLLKATLLADRPGCEMNVTNRLWCQKDYKFRQSFLDINQNQFRSEIGLVDFKHSEAARKLINDWIENKTKQRIKDAIQPGTVHELTRFAIINAIYFKGKWEDSFSKQNTQDRPFYANDKTINVPMMSLTDTRHRYAEIDGLQILEKNYLGGNVSMLILLPTKQHASLALVESMLSAKQLKEWTEALGKRAVDVYLPRFKMETSYPLVPALEKLGMRKAFSLKEADFSGIKEESDPFAIDTLIHKTSLQVDEEGTEAAAVASMGMCFGGPVAALKHPVFRADHPFLFLIRDTRTGCILFIGRVMLPPKDAEN